MGCYGNSANADNTQGCRGRGAERGESNQSTVKQAADTHVSSHMPHAAARPSCSAPYLLPPAPPQSQHSCKPNCWTALNTNYNNCNYQAAKQSDRAKGITYVFATYNTEFIAGWDSSTTVGSSNPLQKVSTSTSARPQCELHVPQLVAATSRDAVDK